MKVTFPKRQSKPPVKTPLVISVLVFVAHGSEPAVVPCMTSMSSRESEAFALLEPLLVHANVLAL